MAIQWQFSCNSMANPVANPRQIAIVLDLSRGADMICLEGVPGLGFQLCQIRPAAEIQYYGDLPGICHWICH